MTDHEGALVAALVARLAADAGVRAALGDPARIWDQPPGREAETPHLRIGEVTSRPVAAADCGIEHRLTLTVVSRFPGAEEARAAAAAVRACLTDAALDGDGARTVNLTVAETATRRSGDRRRAYADIRLRAVTEEAGSGGA